jgi:holo-[acyl-carrier protein] synthase
MSPLLGLGLDLVDVTRIRGALERHGGRFLDRIAGAGEGRLARPPGASAATDMLAPAFVEHVAGLFAAKEAVLKALGTGAAEGLAFRDVIVESSPSGRPTIRLQGGAARLAQELGVARVLLSITHERGYAAAVAVLEAH